MDCIGAAWSTCFFRRVRSEEMGRGARPGWNAVRAGRFQVECLKPVFAAWEMGHKHSKSSGAGQGFILPTWSDPMISNATAIPFAILNLLIPPECLQWLPTHRGECKCPSVNHSCDAERKQRLIGEEDSGPRRNTATDRLWCVMQTIRHDHPVSLCFEGLEAT
jgi:hypothetical protein